MESSFKATDEARAKARAFIEDEKQFRLGFLPTGQSNPITAALEYLHIGREPRAVRGPSCA